MNIDTRPDGLVLCGGHGTRLGGIDKPLRVLAGQRLIERVLHRLALQAGTLIISSNRNLAAYAKFGHAVVEDGQWTDRGPLAGIAAGLDHATTDTLLCVPGDAPLLPLDLKSRFQAKMRDQPGASIIYAHDGRGPQPLCCLIRCELREELQIYLAEGGTTPHEWFRRHDAVSVRFETSPHWAWSINTPQEWDETETRLAP